MILLSKYLKKLELWAVVISLFALLVSLYSLFAAQEQLKITKGQVRSYVQVLDAELAEPIQTANFFKVNLKLKNVGQTAAIKVKADMGFELGMPGSADNTGAGRKKELQNFGPGVERSVQLTSVGRNNAMWPKPQFKYPPTFYFFGSVWAIDDTTKDVRREDWCYFIKTRTDEDLKSTRLEPCDILTYEPKKPIYE